MQETIIKLNDILGINESEYKLWTICLNENGDEGTYSLSGNKQKVEKLKRRISWKKGKNAKQIFRRIDTPLCLQFLRIDRKENKWLFLGAYSVNGSAKDESGNETYTLKPYDKYSGFNERLIVEYKKNQGPKQAKIKTELLNEISVIEILPKKYVESNKEFPGYENIKISFNELSNIIENNDNNWRKYLSIAQCIYLITDKSNGKLYVGSTYGYDGIWQRWSSYVYTKGHGGDKELKPLIKADPDYAYKNFQFSILETFLNINGNEQKIRDREVHWKKVLVSIKFGYNKNY